GTVAATDGATVQDLRREELAFRLKPGETIETGQLAKSGKVASLLRIPKGATAAPPLDKPGVYATAAASGIVVSEVVAIQPTVTTDILRGALAVSWLVDPKPFLAELESAKIPARIELAGKTVVATGAAIPAEAPTHHIP